MALQSDQEKMDRNILQQLFGFMQQWPNLPKSIKLREIARSGMDDLSLWNLLPSQKISPGRAGWIIGSLCRYL